MYLATFITPLLTNAQLDSIFKSHLKQSFKKNTKK